MATAESNLNPNERNERLWRQTYAGSQHNSEQRQQYSFIGKQSQINVGENERVVSGIGGGLLAAYGLTRGDLFGVGLALLGSSLVYRSATGYCAGYNALGINTAAKENMTSVKASSSVRVDQAMTINAPVEEIYNFWRNFENLPQFMYHLESVTKIDEMRSHWKAKAPLGMTVEWDAEIISEIPNELISWRSVEGADVANAGSVRFLPSTGGRGTVVKVELRYEPPAGKLGAAVAWLTGEEPSVQIRDDLRRFKQLMETGEIPTIEGQPAGRSSSTTKYDRK
ncbi:MAG: DUF2892 domain-containing protein [Acidobacteriota bacterium]|nr:DUF2892 domain-containing protein [Acidobacteriota bacterium]